METGDHYYQKTGVVMIFYGERVTVLQAQPTGIILTINPPNRSEDENMGI